MPTPSQVGITGGIGSGKSTVANIVACLGVPVYNADTRAKSLMVNDATLINQIKQEFGDKAYDFSSSLNRKFLAEQVFGFPERLEKLNALVHPHVAKDYHHWLGRHQTKPYILKEAALLFESGSALTLDKIIAVTAPEALRLQRVMERDGRTKIEVQNIMHRQWPQAEIVSRADYIIVNDGAYAIIPQVLKLHAVFNRSGVE